ncbi:MAG TPA: nucleotidyltransferase family protein [bacterium]|nr:nucleotidyltransferase family protein [bacterium]
MKALILAAGFATRLYPLTEKTAKPLLPVAGKPMIEYITDSLRGLSGLDTVYVVTNRKFHDDFCAWRKGYRHDAAIEIINDGSTSDQNKLGAIGDIDFAVREKGITDDLLVIAGDNLFDLQIPEFVRFAEGRGATIAAYDIGSVADARRFGVVSVDRNNFVEGFEEKPYNPRSSLVAMCLYYFPKGKLPLIGKYLSGGNSPDAPGNYIAWLSRAEKVACYVFTGSWFDIGSFESLDTANRYWEGRKEKGWNIGRKTEQESTRRSE